MVLAFDTPASDDPVLTDLEAVPLAVVRHHRVTLDELRPLFDAGFDALGAAVGYGTLHPVGPAIAIYHGDPRAIFDLEIGFPLAEALPGPIQREQVSIEPAETPAGRAAVLTHHGSYDGLGESWGRLASAAVAAGGRPSGVWIEVYVSDPADSDAPLRTDLVLPLEA